jgi:hypothetical protein
MAQPSKTGGKKRTAKTRKASLGGGSEPVRAKRRISRASSRTKRFVVDPGKS